MLLFWFAHQQPAPRSLGPVIPHAWKPNSWSVWANRLKMDWSLWQAGLLPFFATLEWHSCSHLIPFCDGTAFVAHSIGSSHPFLTLFRGLVPHKFRPVIPQLFVGLFWLKSGVRFFLTNSLYSFFFLVWNCVSIFFRAQLLTSFLNLHLLVARNVQWLNPKEGPCLAQRQNWFEDHPSSVAIHGRWSGPYP